MNKQFINVLKRLNPITDKVILKYPITTISSAAGDIIANIDVTKLDVHEFEEIGIYELSKLISLLDLFGDYEIEKDNNTLKVTSRTNSAVFTLADIMLLEDYNKPSSIIERTETFDCVSEFRLSSEELIKFKKASGIFDNLNSISFESIDNNITIKLEMSNRFDMSNNSYKCELLNVSNKNFKINLDINNFTKLPNKDYNVRVRYNSEKDAYRIIFDGEDFKCVIANLSS